MKEQERLVIGGLVVVLLILWLGFAVHRSPWFAGSAWGGLLGTLGALLMLIPLAYLVVKRVSRLRKAVTRWVSMRTLLTWHIYAGVLGPILVLLHTGHKFESRLGIALTAMTLIVVVSGFVGRYLMNRIGHEIKEKTAILSGLRASYEQTMGELRGRPELIRQVRPFIGMFSRLRSGLFLAAESSGGPAALAGVRAVRLAEAMADLEYAIRTHEMFKRAFSRWLRLHIVLSVILYLLLALHVWAGIHFGLRWFG